MNNSIDLVTAVREAIRRDGRSQRAIALAGGLDPGLISRFMRAERDIELATAAKILAALNLQVRLVRQQKRSRVEGR